MGTAGFGPKGLSQSIVYLLSSIHLTAGPPATDCLIQLPHIGYPAQGTKARVEVPRLRRREDIKPSDSETSNQICGSAAIGILMTLSPKRENDSAAGSLLRRELPTGLRDGDGSAAGGSAFLKANS